MQFGTIPLLAVYFDLFYTTLIREKKKLKKIPFVQNKKKERRTVKYYILHKQTLFPILSIPRLLLLISLPFIITTTPPHIHLKHSQ